MAETLFVLREAIHIADLGHLIPRSADQKLDIVGTFHQTMAEFSQSDVHT